MSSVWTSTEKDELKEKYGCEILIECGSIDQVTSNKYPSDAYIVKYEVGDKLCYDLSRGTKIDLFDMYYDKFKKALKSIEYGMGNIKPQLIIEDEGPGFNETSIDKVSIVALDNFL